MRHSVRAGWLAAPVWIVAGSQRCHHRSTVFWFSQSGADTAPIARTVRLGIRGCLRRRPHKRTGDHEAQTFGTFFRPPVTKSSPWQASCPHTALIARTVRLAIRGCLARRPHKRTGEHEAQTCWELSFGRRGQSRRHDKNQVLTPHRSHEACGWGSGDVCHAVRTREPENKRHNVFRFSISGRLLARR